MKGLTRKDDNEDDLEIIEGIFEGNDDDIDVTPLDDTQRSVKLMLRSKHTNTARVCIDRHEFVRCFVFIVQVALFLIRP
jgi:hypothetical protein